MLIRYLFLVSPDAGIFIKLVCIQDKLSVKPIWLNPTKACMPHVHVSRNYALLRHRN